MVSPFYLHPPDGTMHEGENGTSVEEGSKSSKAEEGPKSSKSLMLSAKERSRALGTKEPMLSCSQWAQSQSRMLERAASGQTRAAA